jgi:PAS domain S-box-containing protein
MSVEETETTNDPSLDLGPDGTEGIAWQLLDTGPDAMVVVDEHGRIVLVNLQAERLFGYPRRELLGQAIEILIPERFRGAHVAQRLGFTRAPRARPMGSGLELFGRRRDGREFPVEISLSPLSLPGRTLISANVRDVSERKQQELTLRRMQGHLLSAIESIPAAFAIFDVSDRLVVCNSTCRYMLGRRIAGEIIGRTFEEILDENIAAGTFTLGDSTPATLRARCLSYHRTPEGGLQLKTSDNRDLRIVERRTAEGGTVTTIWDVTDEVEREAELVRTRSIAEAASSAKSEFLASMSHELRTPLNAILGFAQLLKRDKKMPLPERHQERVDHVLKGGEHLLRLIDEVLDLARIEAGGITVSAEPVSVNEVLAEVKTTLDPMAVRAEIAIDVPALTGDTPPVQADRTRFKQILMNYGSNAIKYGKKQGSVTFRARQGDGSVVISVVDDGFGIPQDKQDKIFSPFHRAGQETGSIEGTGIGLAISKRLAELMGGRVGFRSDPGNGSEFWVELPIASQYDAADRKEIREDLRALAGAGPRHTVVYVEDNPSNIAFMEDLLADFDRVELITAPTAEIGIELVRARLPSVVIMDIHLPGMSGFEALQRLRTWKETRDIPVVGLSAAAMVRDAERVQRAGFYRYLTKPVKVDELAKVLAELLLPKGEPAPS